MGKNSKAKRDARVKAARRRSAGPSPAAGPSLSYSARNLGAGDMGPVPGSLFRSTCSDCGSARLAWMSPVELEERVPVEVRPEVQEVLELVGRGAGAEAWLCEDCGHFGVMAA